MCFKIAWFSGVWFCYVYEFILYQHIPMHIFYKQHSSFNTNLSFVFFLFFITEWSTQFKIRWKSRPIVFVCLQLGAFWCFFIFDPRPYKLVGHQFIPLICVFISLSIKEKLAVQAGETVGTLFWQMLFLHSQGSLWYILSPLDVTSSATLTNKT